MAVGGGGAPLHVGVFPKDCSEELSAALALSGVTPTLIGSLEGLLPETTGDWSMLLVELGDEPMRRLRLTAETHERIGIPVIVAVEPAHYPLITSMTGITDLITSPIDPAELGLRLRRLVTLASTGEILNHDDLVLNTLTYQASLDGTPLDLTFMEYELLRYLVEHPRRVWTREQLLSKVWGYDYFGGARTVDVHVRRLRAKLGEERASWISTVRSVGYRFG